MEALPDLPKELTEQMLERIRDHAPENWEAQVDRATIRAHLLSESLDEIRPVRFVVLAGDMRRSTVLMKEAVHLTIYARLLSALVSAIKEAVQHREGWLDKFTGDGFIAYWPVEKQPISGIIESAVAMARGMVLAFEKQVEPELLRNSRNFPGGVGFSCGLDCGPAQFAWVADDLTILGLPVVGAVRMLETAGPREVVANIQVGERFSGTDTDIENFRVTARPEERGTKEYPQQTVYPLSFTELLGLEKKPPVRRVVPGPGPPDLPPLPQAPPGRKDA